MLFEDGPPLNAAVGLVLGAARRPLHVEERRSALLAEVKGHVKNVYNTHTNGRSCSPLHQKSPKGRG